MTISSIFIYFDLQIFLFIISLIFRKKSKSLYKNTSKKVSKFFLQGDQFQDVRTIRRECWSSTQERCVREDEICTALRAPPPPTPTKNDDF